MSRGKLWKTKFSKISKFLLIFAVITAWIFSGFPQIWREPPFPPKIQEAQAAVAAVEVDAVSTGSALALATITISHTTSGTNRLMVVGVSMNNDLYETVSSVTYGGADLTFLGTNQSDDDARVEMWYKVAPATGTANVVVTFSTTLDEGAVVGVITFTGVDQSTPLGTFASANGIGLTPTVNVSSAPGELVIDTVAGEDAVSHTVGAGQTERWNLNDGNPTIGTREYGAGSTEPGASTVTMSWTRTNSDPWAIGAVPIKPAPIFNQSAYRLFNNTNSTDVGSALAARNRRLAISRPQQPKHHPRHLNRQNRHHLPSR